MMETNVFWVQCENHNCMKWRKVYKGDINLDNPWYCHMNKDKQHNHCTDPEQKLEVPDGLTVTFSSLPVGEIVWAKMISFPKWPAIITPDPLNGNSHEYDNDDDVIFYHVEFFGKSHSHVWIQARNVECYGFGNRPHIKDLESYKCMRSKKLKASFEFACEEANDISKYPSAERLLKCYYKIKTTIQGCCEGLQKGKQNLTESSYWVNQAQVIERSKDLFAFPVPDQPPYKRPAVQTDDVIADCHKQVSQGNKRNTVCSGRTQLVQSQQSKDPLAETLSTSNYVLLNLNSGLVLVPMMQSTVIPAQTTERGNKSSKPGKSKNIICESKKKALHEPSLKLAAGQNEKGQLLLSAPLSVNVNLTGSCDGTCSTSPIYRADDTRRSSGFDIVNANDLTVPSLDTLRNEDKHLLSKESEGENRPVSNGCRKQSAYGSNKGDLNVCFMQDQTGSKYRHLNIEKTKEDILKYIGYKFTATSVEHDKQQESKFWHNYNEYRKACGIQDELIISWHRKKVNPYTLYQAVQKHGGFDKVCRAGKEIWTRICQRVVRTDYKCSFNQLKRAYKRLLLPFESYKMNKPVKCKSVSNVQKGTVAEMTEKSDFTASHFDPVNQFSSEGSVIDELMQKEYVKPKETRFTSDDSFSDSVLTSLHDADHDMAELDNILESLEGEVHMALTDLVKFMKTAEVTPLEKIRGTDRSMHDDQSFDVIAQEIEHIEASILEVSDLIHDQEF